jgi:tetratricopeptide (TPR) repeat protein
MRPAWARTLDRFGGPLARLAGKLLGRPSEALLEALARQDRPARHGGSTVGSVEGGRRALSEGRYAEALHRFGQVLERSPDAAWAWHGRGDAFQLMGRPAEALQAYDRAASLQPAVGLHEGGRGNALAALGRAEEADSAWRRALELDPSLTWMRERR